MMGSFRRPRPRFMSSPVLSDLARFHASSPALQISNTSVWNRSATFYYPVEFDLRISEVSADKNLNFVKYGKE